MQPGISSNFLIHKKSLHPFILNWSECGCFFTQGHEIKLPPTENLKKISFWSSISFRLSNPNHFKPTAMIARATLPCWPFIVDTVVYIVSNSIYLLKEKMHVYLSVHNWSQLRQTYTLDLSTWLMNLDEFQQLWKLSGSEYEATIEWHTKQFLHRTHLQYLRIFEYMPQKIVALH